MIDIAAGERSSYTYSSVYTDNRRRREVTRDILHDLVACVSLSTKGYPASDHLQSPYARSASEFSGGRERGRFHSEDPLTLPHPSSANPLLAWG